MKNLKINLAVILMLSAFYLYPQDTSGVWANSKELKITGNAKYKYFFLDKDVYKYAKPDLSDLRIKDQAGKEIPYYIAKGFDMEQKYTADYEPKLIKTFSETSQDKSVFRVFDFQILSDKKDIMVTSMKLAFARDEYSYQAEVYGRKNNTEWQFITKDTVYNIGGFVKEEIKFDENYDYNFYRVKIPENISSLKIKTCMLNYNGSVKKFDEFRNTENPKYEVSNKNKYSVIKIENSYNLKIMRIDLSADSNFSREYELYRSEEDMKTGYYSGTGRIYKMNFSGGNISATSIEPPNVPVSDNVIYLKIVNNNDQPLKITGITVEYVTDKIVFEAPAASADHGNKTITLFFGNPSADKPLYDIENFIPYIDKEKMDQIDVGVTVSKDQKQTVRSNIDFKLIFNIIIAVVAVFLILGIIFLLKKKKV